MRKQNQRRNSYAKILETIFFDKYQGDEKPFGFDRDDIRAAAAKVGVNVPKNLGDVLYAYRYRSAVSESISNTEPEGRQWAIVGAGRGKYCFKLVKLLRLVPNPDFCVIKIPDSTPEIISKYAQGDEQALLAKLRYNRLIDTFLGITAYSLQNHLRTSVRSLGQIEIDEVYVGVDKTGTHYVVPVQAKGGVDQSSVVQTRQDIAWCKAAYPDLVCRPVTAQLMSDGVIALFELTSQKDEISVAEEKHYRLVNSDDIVKDDLDFYKTQIR